MNNPKAHLNWLTAGVFLIFSIVAIFAEENRERPANTYEIFKNFPEWNELSKEFNAALLAQDTKALLNIRLKIEGLQPRNKRDVERTEARNAKLALWILTLDRVNAVIDKNYKPSDRVFINIAPPAGKNGEIYDSGIAPDAIKDPEIREEYKRRLEANKERTKQISIQKRFRATREDWISCIQSFRSELFNRESDEDNKVIERAISAQIKDQALKGEMSRLLLDLSK